MKTIENDALVIQQGSESYRQEEIISDPISHRLLSFIYKLDCEFPLSGGETQEDLEGSIDYLEHEAYSLLNWIFRVK